MNTSKSLKATMDLVFDKIPDHHLKPQFREKVEAAIVEAVEGIYGDSDGLREFAGLNLIKPVPDVPSKRREQNE